jgi:hypothetical protein
VANAGSESEAAAIATKTLGEEAGRRLLPVLRTGIDRINRLASEARSLGLILDRDTVAGANQAAQQLDKLKQVVTLQFTKAIAELGPNISAFTSELADNPDRIQGFVEKVGQLATYLDDIASVGGAAADRIEDIVGLIGSGFSGSQSRAVEQAQRMRNEGGFRPFGDGDRPLFGSGLAAMSPEMQSVRMDQMLDKIRANFAIGDLDDVISGQPPSGGASGGGGSPARASEETIKALNAQWEAAVQQFHDLEKTVQDRRVETYNTLEAEWEDAIRSFRGLEESTTAVERFAHTLNDLRGIASQVGSNVHDAFAAVANFITGNLKDAVANAISGMKRTSEPFRRVLNQVNVAFGELFELMGDWLGSVLRPMLNVFQPFVDAFARLADTLQPLFRVVGRLLSGFGLLHEVMTLLAKPIQWVSDAIAGILEFFGVDVQRDQQALADAERDRMRETRLAAESITRTLADLRSGDLAPITPAEQVRRQRSQFEDALAAARGGDTGAAQRLPDLAQRLLRTGRDVFASGSQYQSLFRSVTGGLESVGLSAGRGGGGGTSGPGFSFPNIGQILADAGQALVDAAKRAGQALVDAGRRVWQWLQNGGRRVWQWLQSGGRRVWNWLQNAGSRVWSWLQSGGQKLWTWVQSAGSKFFDLVKQAGQLLKELWNSLKSSVDNIVDKVKNASGGGLVDTAKSTVQDIGDSLGFAKGGIVDQPTYLGSAGGRSVVGGEAGAEAVMPLGRDSSGRLGVRMLGGAEIAQLPQINQRGFQAVVATLQREMAAVREAIDRSADGSAVTTTGVA